jgi:hypothetical protein
MLLVSDSHVQICNFSTRHLRKYTEKQRVPIILALKRLRQEDCKFETSLGCTVRLCLKKQTNNNTVCI